MGGPKKLYTNQKHISFQIAPRNKNNPYNEYNRSGLLDAICTLSHSALKIYLYFGSFSNLQTGIYLSKQDVMHTTNMSEKSYFTAMKELKEKGFLIQDENNPGNDFYIMYEAPHHW